MKKGFTLIELLAVIVILAVISLIATPMILGVIETSKESSAKVSAYGYIDAVETQIAINELDANKTNIEDGVYEVEQLKNTYGLVVKGELPTSNSWVKIEKGQVVDYSLKIGEYVVNYSESGATTTKGEEITTKPDGSVVKQGPTKIEASETDTHRGIVYLDPTNLSNVCNAENSISTTETKTGCMKWYIYSEDENNYTMILDHNTTARITWNDSDSNVSYESSNLKAVVDDLVTTSGWEVTPRLITADEVSTIIGKTGFDASTPSWYYLDTLTQTNEIFTETKRSKYDWLYNNLALCKTDETDYGCSIEDGNTYSGYGTADEGQTLAYWTSTPVGTAGSGSFVWFVLYDGSLNGSIAHNMIVGVRPVITISKSIIG